MEENLHSINSIKTMEIIDVNTGGKLGFVKDIKIDYERQKVVSVILPGESKGWFSKAEDVEIPWENIVKIGSDVLLVDFNGLEVSDIYS
ncbi:MAG: YlmC/YmxH family sporulation protein [Clostridium sp.]|nr:YlmC/YmxH family sporulation protein [Clostridium sp.]MDY3827642.1 YlmC/YmxH family sporulation protein [Clostridium sp.]